MDKESYDRVTEVISPFTGIEFVPKEVLEPACERGTNVHLQIEGILKGWALHVKDPITEMYVASFKIFWEKSTHIFKDGEMILEQRLFCDENQITGKPDVIIQTQDRIYIIDWKTSSSPQKSWHIQGAAYRHLCEVNGYKNVDSVLFVKLDKTGEAPSLHKSEEHKKNLDIFFKCLELFRHFDMKNTRKEWR